jgi:CheY-like chemotaxis protein
MKNSKILVIEDNDLNMKLVRSLLKRDGYRILEARDAEYGFHLAHVHHPDLILMDIQLPGMDGLSAARVINSDDTLKDIPIVAISGYAMQEDKDKALKAGCVGHISKPLDIRMFSETISQFI